MKRFLISSLIILFLFSASKVRMDRFRPEYTYYSTGTAFQYGKTLTEGQTNAWVVIPPEMNTITIWLKMDGTTNSGIVDFVNVPYNSITNQESGWVWDVGQVSESTNASYENLGTAVRCRAISNQVEFYVVGRVQ